MTIKFETSRSFFGKKMFMVTLDENLDPCGKKSTELWATGTYVDEFMWELSYSLKEDYELVFEFKLNSVMERTLIPIRGLEWFQGLIINDFKFKVK